MTLFLQYAVLGLAAGAGYVILSQGLVVTYVGSGVLNFGQAAMATLGGFIYWQLHDQDHWLFVPAFLVAVLSIGLVGALIHLIVMRPLRNSSSVAQVIATLGIIIVAEAVIILNWGIADRPTQQFLPTGLVRAGGLFIGLDRLAVLGIATLGTLLLWAAYRYSTVGLGIRATAYNRRAAASLGWSYDVLAMFSWALGGMLTTAGLIVLVSFSGIQATSTPLVIFPMLATALIGGFASFPLTLLGGVLIGVSQSWVAGYVSLTGASSAIPLLVIFSMLVVQRKGVIVRTSERLPALGTGKIRWRLAVPLVLTLALLVAFVFPIPVVDALTTSLAWATVMFSVVVLLGFTGQLSFEQVAMGGIAALIAGRLTLEGFPFALAFLVAVIAAVPIGLLFAIPAVRTKGINLAIVTLGLAVTVAALLFHSSKIIGSPEGTPIFDSQRLFGINLDPVAFPERYCLFVLAMFCVAGVVVANIRRGRAGRRLIAVRTNENAAAALGISVFGAKVYAFTVGATVAAVGGILLGFKNSVIVYDFYDPLNSALAVAWSVIGGVGYVLGPLFAAPFPPGGLGTWLVNHFWSNGDIWLSLIGGCVLILILLQDPNGLASMNIKALRPHEGPKQSKLAYLRLEVLIVRGWSMLRERLWGPPKQRPVEALAARTEIRVAPATLEARDITVRFGGVVAVDNVSLTVEPGEIVGLIGPNGAGKTSFINAATGFVKPASGDLLLNGRSIRTLPVFRRARAGLGRTFQSLELFESATVRENLRVASDRRDIRSYLTDLVLPREPPLPAAVVTAIHELELEPYLDTVVSDLPYGVRHLVSVGRSVAAAPSVLMLDEPASGLGAHENADLVAAVKRLAREWGMAILVVEHDMNFVMNVCDRIIVLEFGRQIAHGSPAEIQADPKVITAYLGAPEPLAVAVT